jgi:hypothetical protein
MWACPSVACTSLRGITSILSFIHHYSHRDIHSVSKSDSVTIQSYKHKPLSNLLLQRRNRFSISAINPGTSFDTTAQSTASLISISAPSNCKSASIRYFHPPFLSFALSLFPWETRETKKEEEEEKRERLTLASTNLRDNGSYSSNRVIGLLDGMSYSS